MDSRNKKIRTKNHIEEIHAEKEPTLDEKLDWLKELWGKIGMEGTPIVEDLLEPKNIEKETVLMMKKFLKESC